MVNSRSWDKIFDDHKILKHDFNEQGFLLTAKMIKESCQNFTKTTEKEVRILCKQDSREEQPSIMRENGLFLLPIRNGKYLIIKGEGYFDVPEIESAPKIYKSKVNFNLDTSKIGNSEMQHLDFAYATSLIRTFICDGSLVLTIRGRKYTPQFSFFVGKQKINVKSVQTEVDAGYEGRNKIVLVEAKNVKSNNCIIRQLFYPYKQWSRHTNKKTYLLFFEKIEKEYLIWQYEFTDAKNYNSIKLVRSEKYLIE